MEIIIITILITIVYKLLGHTVKAELDWYKIDFTIYSVTQMPVNKYLINKLPIAIYEVSKYCPTLDIIWFN